ncbi:MAG: putative bicarbonate transporter, IctB family [Synechococcus sp. BS301-5m-G54]|jgi:putative inorganic carbon (HCO3(-)) transporter|uniref:IctB family putative bicarbonate transporter n=1 Tax=Parasynechococcus sp. TaxID=3101203 RepID=UPI000E0875C4|nr:putative bicarbonate transporter, IctB family [Synechococcus sp. BS301-5m-G54]MBL6795340.1 putative bicarbonate transporter, IctB family [Synechococcus sp. BS307-5m-G34]RCL54693.1 MAG: putative bicarbonate transporter, IctB family [Synechococcus sp. MED-G70]HCX53837.1 putative bicarbonate transporter, IctB family [Synechococcus sp. UBA9887]
MAEPLLLRWQGLLRPADLVLLRLEWLSGGVLVLLLTGLPLFTRGGLSLVIAAVALLWLLWSLCSPPEEIGAISGWLLLILGIAVLTTGFSPVPMAAAKGLLKLLSYLSVYALIRKLLACNPSWWDRLLAGLLSGGLLSSVLALRQLYASTEELARWADPNSISTGTIRIYGPLGNPNLLAGYLLPLLPLAAVALLRWKGIGSRLFAGTTLILGVAATVWTYSRGGWIGMLAGLATLMLLLILRTTRHWPPIWRRLLPLAVLLLAAALLTVAATKLEPIRTRVASLLAGRGDSSNNFRINVWLAAIDMIQDRPWLGIGPGNAAFNSVYPLYQQPKFNALSAYSVPLELLVEMGLPGLIAGLGLLWSALQRGLRGLTLPQPAAGAALASLAAITGLLTQGITDTIFFRPEVQLIGWFCLATLAAQPSEA